MTAEPTKKRKWFRIHLSTACVLMFVAAGYVGLNFIPRDVGLDSWDQFTWVLSDGDIKSKTVWGMPFSVYTRRVWTPSNFIDQGINYIGLTFNVVIVSAGVFYIGRFLESLISRNEKPQP